MVITNGERNESSSENGTINKTKYEKIEMKQKIE